MLQFFVKIQRNPKYSRKMRCSIDKIRAQVIKMPSTTSSVDICSTAGRLSMTSVQSRSVLRSDVDNAIMGLLVVSRGKYCEHVSM